jgi:phosphatidylglycerol:prolipoprotein diacylglycerol transferase
VIPYFEQPSIRFGAVTIYAFGVIVAASVTAGLTVAGGRMSKVGLDRELGERLMWWALIGGFVTAHLFSVIFYFPREVGRNPLILFKLWEDVSSFGGMLGGLVGMALFFWLRAPSIDARTQWAYLDVAAFVFPISLMIGRLACTLAHDHPGTITRFPLAVSLESARAQQYITNVYQAAGRLAELPPTTQLAGLGFNDLGWYEFLWLGVIVVPATLVLSRRPRPAGFFILLFVALYMPVRFALDFVRVGDIHYFGLTPGQWLAAASAMLALLMLVTGYRVGTRAPLSRRDRVNPGAL